MAYSALNIVCWITIMSTAGNCSTLTIVYIPAKCSMSKHKIYFDQFAMELMAENFELPPGVLDYKAGWTLALATSMTFTTLHLYPMMELGLKKQG